LELVGRQIEIPEANAVWKAVAAKRVMHRHNRMMLMMIIEC